MENRSDEVRRQVSKAYAEAVTRTQPGGCCGGGVRGTVPQAAGYSAGELSVLPPEATDASFGCGNPVALSGLREGDVVLDLGSGAGMDLLLAAQKVGPRGRVIGIDMTDEMIARARANIRKAGAANVEVRKGIIEDLPVDSGSVDWVISNCVINLSPEKPKVFREIARVLKPGGRMLVSDIVAQDLPKEVLESVALYASCVAGAISEADYLSGLRASGLSEVEVRGRLVYDAAQIEGIAGSQIEALCCGAGGDAKVSEIARLVAGKVWSASFYARKPA